MSNSWYTTARTANLILLWLNSNYPIYRFTSADWHDASINPSVTIYCHSRKRNPFVVCHIYSASNISVLLKVWIREEERRLNIADPSFFDHIERRMATA